MLYFLPLSGARCRRQSRLEYDRGDFIMGSALSNTCCFSRVSTTMRADPHVRYRRHSNEKKNG